MEEKTYDSEIDLNKAWAVIVRYGSVLQAIELANSYLTYDENSDIILIAKDSLDKLVVMLKREDFKNEERIDVLAKRISDAEDCSSVCAGTVIRILIKHSMGVYSFQRAKNGKKIPNEWLNDLGLLSGRFLGCSVIGVAKDHSLKIIRKLSETVGDMRNIDEKRFVMLYCMLSTCYEDALGLPAMSSYMGILITTLCAEADIKSKIKFENHSRYFDTEHTDQDCVHELERTFRRTNVFDDATETLARYVKAVLYTEKELESTILKRKGDSEAIAMIDKIDKLEARVQMSNEVIAMLKKEYLPEHLRYYTLEELYTKLKEEQAPKGMNVF